MDWVLPDGLRKIYSQLWKLIIRPQRDIYDLSELGPKRVRVPGHDGVFMRTDASLQNDRGMKLECSHWEPIPEDRPSKQMPCVIFLHGNCSSRIEGMDLLVHLLPLGITVFCFDFSGSGLSGGEYVSLSYFEKEDLKVVIQHLRSQETVSGIGIWGRSMGAATAIFHAAIDSKIHACVLDSPFADLKVVATELVDRGRFKVPHFLLNIALEIIRSEIQSRADFDLNECRPVSQAHKATCPALFAVAHDDSFVLPHHTRDLYEIWGGRADLVDFEGGHNGERPAWFIQKACDFLIESFKKPPEDPRSPDFKARHGLPKQPASEGTSPNVSLPSNEARARAALPELNPTAAALRDKVIEMGFDNDSATHAAKRCSSVEACIDWIMQQFEEAALGSLQAEGPTLRPPGTARALGYGQEGSTSVEAPGFAVPPPPSSTGGYQQGGAADSPVVAKVDVAAELQNLGFSAEDAAEAAKRCSSVEAALDWLERRGGA